MDIVSTKAVTPVSPGLPQGIDRKISTAGTQRPAAVSPIVAAPEQQQTVHIEAIARQLQEYLSSSERDVEFRIDADTNTQVITVRDGSTGDIIRQFPGEEVLRAFKNMNARRSTLLDTSI
ncbi:MAG: flagellar protein FlaG [Steroidobacteraceae bacterium]